MVTGGGRGRCRARLAWLLGSYLLTASICYSQYYRQPVDEDPLVRAILTDTVRGRAWIDFDGQRFHVVPGEVVAKRWVVEEIRRDSILFRRFTPPSSFLSAPLSCAERAMYHRDWSFWGEPLGLWEGLELLSAGFKRKCIMHHEAGGTVVPRTHGRSYEEFLRKLMPPRHRYVTVGPVVAVFPVDAGTEHWMALVKRWSAMNPARLTIRFPGLGKSGTVLARGQDLPWVLRQIALGSSVPMQFPKDLHLPVYAWLPDLPFYTILAAVVYGNGCFLIERTDGLEIRPWPRQSTQSPLPEDPARLEVIANDLPPPPAAPIEGGPVYYAPIAPPDLPPGLVPPEATFPAGAPLTPGFSAPPAGVAPPNPWLSPTGPAGELPLYPPTLAPDRSTLP